MSRLAILVVVAMVLALALPDSAAATLNEVKLLASDAETGDVFGWSVAVSGDTAIVGARREDAGGIDAGAAYIFQRDQGGPDNWGELKKLTASDIQEDDEFGSSVAISGDTALVGAPREDANGFSAGAVYVFNRNQGGADNWGEVKKLLASDAQDAAFFGRSVAVSGDTAIVGAPNDDTGGNNAGAAYVFRRDQGGTDNWGEVTKLLASDAQSSSRFGFSVTVSGDTAVIGTGGSTAGAVYVFQRDHGGTDTWGELTMLLAPDTEAGDAFGWGVAVSGDTAVVGSLYEEAAYVYQRDHGGTDNWGEVMKLVASDADFQAFFGYSVAISGTTTVVGAFIENSGAGASYVFQQDEGGSNNWGEVNKLTASDAQGNDQLGFSVAVSGTTGLAGAQFEADGGDNAGAAYIFDLQDPKATPTPTATPTLNPVGGIALDADLRRLPLEASDADRSRWGVAVAIAAAASLAAVGGAAWYARRRWLT